MIEEEISKVIQIAIEKANEIQTRDGGISQGELMELFFDLLSKKLKQKITYTYAEFVIGLISMIWISHTLVYGTTDDKAEKKTLSEVWLALQGYKNIMDCWRIERNKSVSSTELDLKKIFDDMRKKEED